MSGKAGGAPLTGRKVLAIAVAFFAVIIAVNGYMMMRAVGGFPGLVEQSPYAASQRFDADMRAARALGWRVSAAYGGGALTVTVVDEGGAPVRGLGLSAVVGRPATMADDRPLTLIERGGVYAASVDLPSGRWRATLSAAGVEGASRIETPFEVRGGG